MAVRMRQTVERNIVSRVITDLIAAGFEIGVENPDEGTLEYRGTDPDKLRAALFQCDDERVYVYHPADKDERDAHGWVRFIYGNDGWDVISDYTTNLEPHMKNADALANYYGADGPWIPAPTFDTPSIL